MLEQRGRILCLDIGHGMRATFVADQQRIAGGEITRAGRLAVGRDKAAIGVLRDAGRDALGDDPGGGVLAEVNLTSLPVITRMDFGHTDPKFVLPIGVPAEIDCDAKQIRLLESATIW